MSAQDGGYKNPLPTGCQALKEIARLSAFCREHPQAFFLKTGETARQPRVRLMVTRRCWPPELGAHRRGGWSWKKFVPKVVEKETISPNAFFCCIDVCSRFICGFPVPPGSRPDGFDFLVALASQIVYLRPIDDENGETQFLAIMGKVILPRQARYTEKSNKRSNHG